MTKNKNTPKLRFPEFSEEWEEKKLGDIAFIKGRIGWKNLKQSEYTKNGPYLIAGKHIHNGVINWEECDHISYERYEESKEIALKEGDVIFSKDGSLGNPALIKNLNVDATINGTMMLVRFIDKLVDSGYFYQILNSKYFIKLLWVLKSGSSIPHIFQRDMKNFKFPLSQIKEQEKVADFLTIMDEKISLLENRLDLFNDFKKFCMQQLFAQKLRFKNAKGKNFLGWEKKCFEELLGLQGGFAFKSSLFTTNETQNKVIKIGDVKNIINLNSLKVFSNETPSDIYKVTDGDFLIALSGATFGKNGLIEGNGYAYVNQRVAVFNCEKTDSKFIYQLINTSFFRAYLNSIPTSSAQPNISNSDILNYKTLIPSLKEQEKIGNFLTSIDNKIEKLNYQINQTKEFKKGLLQQMFI